MRCQAMRRVRDITAEVIIVCDLDADHAEDYHHDKFNRTKWWPEDPPAEDLSPSLPFDPRPTLSAFQVEDPLEERMARVLESVA